MELDPESEFAVELGLDPELDPEADPLDAAALPVANAPCVNTPGPAVVTPKAFV